MKSIFVMKPFNDITREEIIRKILEEVHSQGSARVGFHAEQILASEKPIPYNIKSKIEATITSKKKYISRDHPNFKNDFEIMINPNYEEEKDNLELQQLRTNNILLMEQLIDLSKIKKERKLAIIISIISIIVNIILVLLN